MDFLAVMHSYFRGERVEALFYIMPAGALLAGMAATAALGHRNGFGWGVAIPMAICGVLLLGVGGTVAARTPGQVAELERAYERDPAAMVAEELPRMDKVNANWPRLMTAWTVFVIAGLALRFGLRADWAHGAGIALIACGAVGFLIDGFAERRARPYTDALQALAAATPP